MTTLGCMGNESELIEWCMKYVSIETKLNEDTLGSISAFQQLNMEIFHTYSKPQASCDEISVSMASSLDFINMIGNSSFL